jgi:signal transduction histidine kinase
VRLRLVAVLVGVVALVLAVHDLPLASHLERVERDRLNTGLERDAFLLGMRAEEALEEGTAADDTTLRAVVLRYAAEEELRVVVTDATATVVAASDDAALDDTDFSNRQEIVDAISEGAPQTGQRFSNTLGEDLFYVAVPVLSGIERIGAVRISAPDRIVSDRVSSRVQGIAFVALISLAISVFVAWFFARSVAQPLTRLRTATDRLAHGELSTRADSGSGPPEVRALAGSFNSMAGRLEQLVERQRAFAGTASHQLRTPLTALRLRLEQLAEQVAGDAARTHTLDAALAETDRLHRMIEGLLALSRAEDAAVGPVAVDVGALVRERAEHWAPLADEQQVELISTAPRHTLAMAVPGAVEQIVDNLVDNALEVSPPGSQLLLSVAPGATAVELHVIDEGPGLSDEDRARAFERFWRADESSPGGTGLGLAIVHQLVAAGDGTAELRAAPTGGIDAVVTFRPPTGGSDVSDA